MTRQVSAQALSRPRLNHPLQCPLGGAAQHRLERLGSCQQFLGMGGEREETELAVSILWCLPVPKAFIRCEAGLLARS